MAGLVSSPVNRFPPADRKQMEELLDSARVIERTLASCIFCSCNAGLFFKWDPDAEDIPLDDSDQYAAVCRSCYDEKEEDIARGTCRDETVDSEAVDTSVSDTELQSALAVFEGEEAAGHGDTPEKHGKEGTPAQPRESAGGPEQSGGSTSLKNRRVRRKTSHEPPGLARQQSMCFIEPTRNDPGGDSSTTSRALATPAEKPGLAENQTKRKAENSKRHCDAPP